MARFFGCSLLVLLAVALGDAVPRVRRLAGGKDVEANQYPYMAAIKFDGKLVCGGAIISPTKILTAANCIYKCTHDKDPSFRDCKSLMTISTGSEALSKAATVSRVKSVKVPSNFVLGKYANDIGIITLESPIKFSPNEKSIDLPDKDLIENSVAISTGWGAKSANDKYSDVLQSLKETVTWSSKCSALFKDRPAPIDPNDFCGIALPSSDKAGLCIGDSGDPLIQDGKIIGISTWGIGCAEGYPDVFTNVYKNLNFIQGELLQ